MVKYYIISYFYLTSHLFTIKTEVFSWNLCSAPSQAFFWLIGRLDINVTFWTVFVINKESCNLAISNYYLGHTVEINIVCVCGYCINISASVALRVGKISSLLEKLGCFENSWSTVRTLKIKEFYTYSFLPLSSSNNREPPRRAFTVTITQHWGLSACWLAGSNDVTQGPERQTAFESQTPSQQREGEPDLLHTAFDNSSLKAERECAGCFTDETSPL